MDEFVSLFDSSSFMPHGHCYLWKRDILAMHVGSDLLTALAYYTIPIALISFTRRRHDFTFGWVFYMFSGFIFACGTTHLFAVWTTWNPDYATEGLIKVATAGISVATAIAIWPLLPKALAIPSPEKLTEANEKLQAEVQERQKVEAILRELRSKEILSEDRERRKLGVELHDGLGQVLTLLNMQLGAARDQGGEAVASPIRRAQELAKEAQHQIRTLAFELSPPVLHDVGLGAAAEWLVEDVQARFGLHTRLDAGSIPLVPNEAARLTMFRAMRELLANVAEHAGVDEAEMKLWAEDDRVYGQVSDAGNGFDPTQDTSGFGLFSVRDELEQLGGELDVQSERGEGSRMTFWLPTGG